MRKQSRRLQPANVKWPEEGDNEYGFSSNNEWRTCVD